ncbi:MAG: tetratricopeptide repeat protein [Acidobacteriota bacterium]
MKKIGIILILFFLFCIFIFSQDYKGKARVTGIVSDEEGKPLEGVKVKLYSVIAGGGFEVMTDASGKWVGAWMRGGMWNIDFEKNGYMPKKISVEIYETQKNPPIEVRLKKMEGKVITDELKAELARGNQLFDEKKYQEAMLIYEDILKKFPDIYIINKNIGNCYFLLENYEKAEEYYLKVLEKEPNNYEIMLLIGNCYANRGENEKALEWYGKIVFEKINDPTVLYNIGTNYYNNSKFEDALKYYKRAVEIKADFLDALYQLGLTHLTMGSYRDAIGVFENYLKYDPDSERASQVKGFIEFLKKKIEEK